MGLAVYNDALYIVLMQSNTNTAAPTLETLCADAITRLPTLGELTSIAAMLFPGQPLLVATTGEDAWRAGDSLAARSITAYLGSSRITVSALWLDRRDSDGSPLGDDLAPRGFVDLRVLVIDEDIERSNRAIRAARRRKGLRSDEQMSLLARAGTSADAIAHLLASARKTGCITTIPLAA